VQSEITYNLKAFITLLPTENGGRKKSIFSGYKPSLVFNTHKSYSAEIQLIDTDELQPGQTSMASIKLLPARTIRKNLQLNDAFTLVEGNKAVGNGIIIAEISKKENSI
jgi:translation elongation factor EF-Tu-like GTPase